MTVTDAFTAWFRALLIERQWSVRVAAQQLGLSRHVVDKLRNGQSPSLATVVAVAAAMDVPVSTFVRYLETWETTP